MEHPDSLEGMARSIDALFSDAERRHARADLPTGAAEEGVEAEATEAAAATERPPEAAGADVEASVASADLLDDVEVIAPRPRGAGGVVPIDADDEEDPRRLAEAAAWGLDPTGLDAPSSAPDAEALDVEPTALDEGPATLDADLASLDAGFGTSLDGGSTLDADLSSLDDAAPTLEADPSSVEAAPTEAHAGWVDAGAAPADTAPAADVRRTLPPDEVALRARATVTAVEEYLRAEPSRREEAADAVREAAAAHRDARELDAPADAVERLALADDPGAVELARELAVSPVASRVVVRLGMAREDERREELFRVAEALGDALAPALADALSDAEDRSARRNFVEALVRLGDTGVREAEAMIADPRWFVVRNGVAILGEVGGSRVVENLTSTLGHEHPRVRRETLVALARVGGEDAGILASGKLEDPEAEVRAAAAMAVGALRVERAQRTLQALLEREEDEDVLVEVLRALGRLGDPGAVSAIEKKAVGTFFSRPPTEVRAAAYRALASIGTPHARRVIEDAAEDKDAEVRRLATALLQER